MADKNTYQDLTIDELQEQISAEAMKLQKMRFNHAVTQLDNPMQIRTTRRTIAQLKTELRKRQTKQN